jgi:hypothetical protein
MRKNEWTHADDARLLQMVAQKRHLVHHCAASLKRTRSGVAARLRVLRRETRRCYPKK